jgi:CheY-like chemotaxis protein
LSSTAINSEEGLELAESQGPDLILLDIGLLGINGIEALARMKKVHPEAVAIMITAGGTIESAVAAVKTTRSSRTPSLPRSDLQGSPDGCARYPGERNGFQLPLDGVILDDLIKDLNQQALEMTSGNQVRVLGLTQGMLRYRLDKYGIQG